PTVLSAWGKQVDRKLLIRVTAPAVAIGLLLLGTCAAGVAYINRLQKNLTNILSQNVASLQAAQELEIRVRQLRFHNLPYFLHPTPSRLAPTEADQEHSEEAMVAARESATTGEQRDLVRLIEDRYQKYHAEMGVLRTNMTLAKSPDELKRLLDTHPITNVVEPCHELLALNRTNMAVLEQESRNVGRRGNLAMVLLGLAGPVSGIAMGFGVARGLSRSIYRLSVRVQDVAQRLERDVASVSLVADGDLQNLDRQLQQIVGRVEEVVARLQQQQRELLRAEQLSAVGQLAAGVAHEVRNPLAGIKLLVESALQSKNAKPLN